MQIARNDSLHSGPRRSLRPLHTLAILKLADDGNNINMLTPQRLTDKGGGPAFYSCLVQVEKNFHDHTQDVLYQVGPGLLPCSLASARPGSN